MIREIILGLAVIAIASFSAKAQIYDTQYRPPGQQWQQLTTPHFNLLFSQKNAASARSMGIILENNYGSTRKLVGGRLSKFPVILNSYNDRSNGFVSSFHFRSEIELPPIKGKAMNPQTGNWLKNVGPHELVHALQFSNIGRYNLPWLVNFFSPDLARSFHGAIPSGVTEGLAVYHKTESIAPKGGRGNYPFFINQFDAVFNSSRRWSMGQMLQNPSATRPFNRHYIGGYEFTSWLQTNYGPNTSRQTLDFYMDFPFLGYGVALRHTTGRWPGQLYNAFKKDKQNTSHQKDIKSGAHMLPIPYKGREIRRPKWLSDSALVFYGSFYNARPGFYQYKLESGKINRLVTTSTVSDYRYDLTNDRTKLIFSFYEADKLYDNTYKAELATYDIGSGEGSQLTKRGRNYAPLQSRKGLWALQTRPASSALVSIQQDSITELLSLGKDQIIAVDIHPITQKVALVINREGRQGLWIEDRQNIQAIANRTPDISFQNGSVFDPEWHPLKQKLMFSSDFSATLQLYEYDLQTDTVRRLTDSPYNAFEGSYSPDATQLAFIRQVGNERLPAIMNYKDAVGQQIPSSLWDSSAQRYDSSPENNTAASKDSLWAIEPYSSGLAWLKPRAVIPSVNEVSGRDAYRLGLSIHSNNLLQNQAYSAEVSYLDNQPWYDISYRNKQFYPGFQLRLYNEPSYFSVAVDNQDRPLRLLRQHRSFSLSTPFNIRLNQNVFSTSLFIRPQLRLSQLRFFDNRDHNNTSNITNSLVNNIYGQFNYRLQQDIRSLQPNSGLILYSELEHFWNSSDLQLPHGDSRLKLNLQQPTALRGGIIGYASPLRRWNQSLRLEIKGFSQSGLIFNNQSLVSDGFSEPVLPQSRNLLSFNSRYSIPLIFADNGGFLLPLYLDAIYLVPFSNTVVDPRSANWYSQSRTVFGVELRSRFRLSNLSFDLGVGFGYEPARDNHQFYLDSF